MERLRDPDQGCPWDQQQDFHSIAPHTIEEAYEVVDAIERNEPRELCEELGDLLFQVVFHSHLAQEIGWFAFADVVQQLSLKLVRRHPHVFGGESINSAQAQSLAWEKHKRQERVDKNFASELDGIANNLPALRRAQKIQKRAAQVNFDWDDAAAVCEKVQEELLEVKEALLTKNNDKITEELGDLLFSVVNLSRHVDADAETVLRSANYKFERRFRIMERIVQAKGQNLTELTKEELNAVWDKVKSEEFAPKAVK